jgi:DNA polymerase III epsilon subunit-like protein
MNFNEMIYRTPILVVDTETTGLGVQACREDVAVSLGCALVIRDRNNLEIADRCHVYIKPDQAMIADGRANEAFRINRIDPRGLAYAPTELQARVLVDAWLREAVYEYPVVTTSFNVGFDRPFTERLICPSHEMIWGRCLMLEATQRMMLPGQYGDYKWPKLEEARRFYGIGLDGEEAHHAGSDAYVAARILIEMAKENSEKVIT